MIPAMSPKAARKIVVTVLAAAALAATPETARADAGIPMLPLPYPTMLLFLLIVIIIEFIYLQARLRPHFGRTLITVTTLNTATTGLGFPLTWIIYVALNWWAGFPGGASGVFNDMQYVPLWVCIKLFPDWSGTRGQVWIILAMFVTLLIPSYLLTRIIKSWTISWYDLLRYNGDPRPAVLMANRLSYLLLAITGCLLLYRTFHGV
jgi:hypothetical protein